MTESKGELLYGVLHLTEDQRKLRTEARQASERAKAAKRAHDNVRQGPAKREAHVDSRSPYMARQNAQPKRERDGPAVMEGRYDRRGIHKARGRVEVSHERKVTLEDMLSSRDAARLKGLKSR